MDAASLYIVFETCFPTDPLVRSCLKRICFGWFAYMDMGKMSCFPELDFHKDDFNTCHVAFIQNFTVLSIMLQMVHRQCMWKVQR